MPEKLFGTVGRAESLSMQSFRRGNGPLVSVLLPTRGRSQSLCEAIDSIYSLAKDKGSCEFILKIDDDDLETQATAKALSAIIPLKMIVSPRGNGYHDMHHWVNEMSSLATGDWLFLFNDDARMKTHDWDKLLTDMHVVESIEGISDICVLVLNTLNRPHAREFMLVRRSLYQILGHYSLSPHNDRWMYAVANMLNVTFEFQIDIEHRDQQMSDEVREHVLAAYTVTSGTLNSLEAIRGKIKDSLTLLEYLESKPTINNDIRELFNHQWLKREYV